MHFKNELYWPTNVSHRKNHAKSRTKSTWLQGLHEMQKICKSTGIDNVTITSNININNANMIHSRRSDVRGVSILYNPPGSKEFKVAFCDKYLKEADNLMAIVKTLKAYREIKKLKVGFVNVELKQKTA